VDAHDARACEEVPAGGSAITPKALLADAEAAIAADTLMVLVRTRPTPKLPGFPRGELLCENHDGNKVYSDDPKKIRAWLLNSGVLTKTER